MDWMKRKISIPIVVSMLLAVSVIIISTETDNVEADYTTNLVGHYKLDESSWGTVDDSSSSNNDGTAHNGASPTSSSRIGSYAGDFDGINDYISAPYDTDQQPTSSLSLCAWIKPDSAANLENIISMIYDTSGWNNPYYSYALKINADYSITFSVGFSDDDHEIKTSANVVSTSKWSHVAGTWDGSTMKIYIDGTLSKSGSESGTIVYDSYGIKIGSYNSNLYFDGKIDDVRIYDDDLSNANLQEIMLMGHWKMDDSSWGSVADSSGHGGAGTAYGNAALDSSCYKVGTKSGEFDGNGDYISIPDSNDLEPDVLTLSAWIHPEDSDAHDNIVSKKYTSSPYYSYGLKISANRHITFVIGLTTGEKAISSPIYAVAYDNWFHVAGTWDGTNMKLYINGMEQTCTGDTGSLSGTIRYNSNVVKIGSYSSNLYFEGNIDDVRIYSKVLSSSEVGDIANNYLINSFSSGFTTGSGDGTANTVFSSDYDVTNKELEVYASSDGQSGSTSCQAGAGFETSVFDMDDLSISNQAYITTRVLIDGSITTSITNDYAYLVVQIRVVRDSDDQVLQTINYLEYLFESDGDDATYLQTTTYADKMNDQTVDIYLEIECYVLAYAANNGQSTADFDPMTTQYLKVYWINIY